jgi:hypothetical protein
MDKKSLRREIFVLHRLEITSRGKDVKRAMSVFIIWLNFGNKFLWHLRRENFFSGFHCSCVTGGNKSSSYRSVLLLFITVKKKQT